MSRLSIAVALATVTVVPEARACGVQVFLVECAECWFPTGAPVVGLRAAVDVAGTHDDATHGGRVTTTVRPVNGRFFARIEFTDSVGAVLATEYVAAPDLDIPADWGQRRALTVPGAVFVEVFRYGGDGTDEHVGCWDAPAAPCTLPGGAP